MLQKFKITFYAIILCLFGLPLMTSSGFSFGVASAFKGKVKRTITTMKKTKPITFLLALTFLFLFSGSVYGQEEVKKEYWDNGKLKTETHYKDAFFTAFTLAFFFAFFLAITRSNKKGTTAVVIPMFLP